MLKTLSIFAILLVLAIYSASAQASPACQRLLSIDEKTYAAIDEILVSKPLKNQLMDQSILSEKMKAIITEFSEFLDVQYTEQFARIVFENPRYVRPQALGFTSIKDLRVTKEQILKSQISLLATIDPQYVTPQFKTEFFEFTERVIRSEVTKYELLLMQESIKVTLKYYSRM